MLNEISDILSRSRESILEDAIGVVALFSMLFVGLALSGAF